MPEYGFARIAVTEEMINLLDRIKDEANHDSRRAVIEEMFYRIGRDEAPSSLLKEASGDHWEEWVEMVESSNEVSL